MMSARNLQNRRILPVDRPMAIILWWADAEDIYWVVINIAQKFKLFLRRRLEEECAIRRMVRHS